MWLPVKLLAASSLLHLAVAFEVKGHIQLFQRTQLEPDSRIILNYGEYTSFVRSDGTFVIRGVPDGEYVLTSSIRGYSTPSLYLTITTPVPPTTSTADSASASASASASEANPPTPAEHQNQTQPHLQEQTIHIQPHSPTHSPLSITSAPSLPHPIVLTATPEDYFTPLGGFNLLGLLKSPMVLMLLASVAMMLGLPKLTKYIEEMDPEAAKEAAVTRQKMQGMQNMDWTGSLSSMLAGTSSDEPVTPAPSTGGNATPARAAGNGAGSARKRRGK